MDKSFLADDLKHVFSQGGEILFWPLLVRKKIEKMFFLDACDFASESTTLL